MNGLKKPQEAGPSSRMSRFGFKKPRIFPPVWLTFALIAMLALDQWLPLVQLTPELRSIYSMLLLLPGLAMVLIAANGFRRVNTGVAPFSKSTTLVTTGLYRFTRNPMYLGMVLFLAGAGLKLGSLGCWIPVPLFIAIIQVQFIRNEELFLTGIYGDEYRAYQRKVRRWI